MVGGTEGSNNPVPVMGNMPESQSPPAKGRPIDERLEELWSVGLPAWLDDWFPQVAQAMADGAWTALVRGVAAYAPVIAFVLGLISRLIFRDLDEVYTESLAFLLLLVAGATLSGTVGVGLLAGYIVQDLLLGNRVGTFGVPNPAGVLAGKAISYVLLAMPAVVLPLLARQLASAVQFRTVDDPRVRVGAKAALDAVIFGVLIYLWSQSMLVLIRPLFSLVGTEPGVSTVSPVQEQAVWLVLVAMVAAAARELVVQLYLPKSPRAGVVANLERWRWTGEKKGVIDRVPEVVRVAVATTVLTMVLAGTFEGWLDTLVVALLIGAIGAWRANLIRQIPVPERWALAIRKVHPLLRLLGATFIAYLLSTIVVAGLWNTWSGLRLLMIGALLTLIVFNAIFPPLPVMQAQQPNAEAQVQSQPPVQATGS